MTSVADPNAVRVILVGRTGLDGVLRHDPAVELIRVRTALEAIGELSDPIDEHSPRRAVVVVGTDADPASAPTMEPVPGADAAAEFVQGLRIVDPDVVVLRSMSGPARAETSRAGAYDGVVGSDEPPEAVCASIRRYAGVIREAKPLPPVPAEARAAAGPAGGADLLDAPLAQELVRGGDILPIALNVIRRRLGDRTIQFMDSCGPAPPPGGVAVTADGQMFGTLVGAGTSGSALAPHGAWLAGWLRLASHQASLREAAFTDALTGAWNRRYFESFLGTAIEQARAGRRNLTVLAFDIDDFKSYNDRFGHSAGDSILVETVRLLRSVVRPTDRVCRVGGDEFVVIFHEPDGPRIVGSSHPRDASEIAHRFQCQIAQHRFPKLAECAPGALTISAGLATFPWDGTSVEELLHTADTRALESKRRGKNFITVGPHAARPAGA